MKRGPYKKPKAARTVAALADAYRASPRFQGWTAHTRGHADRVLHRLAEKHGKAPVEKLTRGTLQQAVDVIAARDGYGAALHWLRIVSGMLSYGVRLDWLAHNPAREVEKPRAPHREGLRTWREDEIAAFLAHHRIGTVPHLALTLMLYTAASRVDACALGWQHVRADRIEYRRQKTAARGGPLISLPIAPPLAEALALAPRDRMTFLETIRRRPRSPNGLTESMREWCAAAGLDDADQWGRRLGCHGLRKAMARRLAELGCSSAQIMAVTGHQTSREVDRYTRAYSREQAATAAFERLGNISPEESSNVRRLSRGKD